MDAVATAREAITRQLGGRTASRLRLEDMKA